MHAQSVRSCVFGTLLHKGSAVRKPVRRTWPLFTLACWALLSACTPTLPSVGKGPATSPSAMESWVATADAKSLEHDPSVFDGPSTFEPDRPSTVSALTVAGAVDIAMRNAPELRSAWLHARAAAAKFGASKAGYYPRLDVGATGSYTHQTALAGRFTSELGTVGPYARLSWLLLDFGQRSANERAELASVLAANQAHAAAIQDHLLSVVDAYYRLVSAEALVRSVESDIRSARTSLDAAKARLVAGRADVGDVLQAETALSRARIAHRGAAGQVDVLRGTLAERMGLAPSTRIRVVPLRDDLDVDSTTRDAGHVLESALRSRPDLLAARASAAAAWQRAQAAGHRGAPTLTLDASASRSYYFPAEGTAYGDNWGATLTFNVPVFAGYADSYEQQRAEWEALAAEADARTLERRIALEVWTAYHQLEMSADQVKEVRSLLDTTEQWDDRARQRYEAGVGTILDLMAAQSALASARSRYIEARADWLLAMVRLTHDTGELARRSISELDSAVAPSTRKPSTTPQPR